MRKKYSVFLGDVALDEYYRADYWPTIKDKANVDSLPAIPGGMIANAACVSAALGMTTKFLGALNSGAISQFLLNDLEESKVDTSLVVFDDSLADSKTMIFLVEDEHTIFIPRLGLKTIQLSKDHLEQLAQAEYIYSTPSEMSALRCGNMHSNDIIDYCRQNGAKLVYDLDVDYIKDNDEERFRRLDIAFFNEVGFDSFRRSKSETEAVRRLQTLGVDLVIITKAENGCVVYSKDDLVSCPAHEVKVVDVTGAGDTFCSSFIFALSEGRELKYAAEFANSAASICVGKLGARAGAVTRQEVEKVMRL